MNKFDKNSVGLYRDGGLALKTPPRQTYYL